MDKRKLILIAFVLVSLVQAYVPASMILDREAVIAGGKLYKFRTEPFDPYDPFRGKYLQLSFREDHFEVNETDEWRSGEKIFVEVSADDEGFARILSVSKEIPQHDGDYIQASVLYKNSGEVYLKYPFEEFYLEESKAPLAEEYYWDANADSSTVAWAEVYIKAGKAVLSDVMIDEVSIRELVHERNLGTEELQE